MTRGNGTQSSRPSFGASLPVLALLVAFFVPVAAQAAPPGTYSSSSNATVLNLQLLALTTPPTLTIAKATSEMTSTPLSAKATGTGVFCVGAGNCQAIADATTASATAPGDADPPQKCENPVPVPSGLTGFLTLSQGCGDAFAKTSTGDPTATSSAGVTTLDAILNVGSLNTTLDATITQIVTQIGTLLNMAPDTAPLNQVKTALGAILSAIAGNRRVLAVEVGAATAKALSEGTTVTGRSDTAVVRIGILPICELAAGASGEPTSCLDQLTADPNFLNPLTHGLLIIEITGGFAEAKWLGTGSGTLSTDGAAAVAKVKVRNLAETGPPKFFPEVTIPLSNAPQTILTGPLETTIKAGSIVKDPAANSVTVNAVEISALKGLKQSATQPGDGGLLLQVGALNAAAIGQLPRATQVLGLPKTGGMRTFFYALAALLIVGAPLIFLISRRLRRSL